MFGNAITSSWANPQQNQQQQQQQQPSAFGQPSTFGSTGFGGGGTSAFGQPQQQQANPMFGNLGGAGTNPGASGFGAFSSNNNNSGSVFGGTKPATGFGAFGGGGTSSFGGGGTGAFGGGATTSAFGQPSTSTNTGSVFGGGGSSIFGQNKGPSAFGSATTTTPTSNPVTTGSSNPPYAVYSEKDPSSANMTLQYQSISCMPAYQGTSLEELRFQDYQQGRKTAQAAPNAFGQSSAFSAQPQTNSVFGQPQNQQINSVFGAPKPATGFGFNANNNSSTGTSIFGSGGNAFGQTQPQQQQQQTQTTGFGAFGQPQQPQQQGTGLFGNTNNNAGSAFGTGGSTLGNTGGAFGQPQPQQQQTSIFGQTQQQPATNTGFGAFGNNNNANKSSIFGQPSQPAQATTTGFGNAGGLFSNNNQNPQGQQTTSLFGNTGSANTGPFGNTNNQQQQGTQPATGGSIFGNTQNQNTGTTGTSLFSGGGGLFGNNNQQQQQQQQPAQNTFGLGGSLFGNKPTAPAGNAGTSLFNSSFQAQQPANNTQQGTGMFGNLGQSTNQQQQSTLGGGLFANANKAPGLGTSTSMGGTGLFSSTLGASTNTFNASAATPGAQGSLTASISQPISTNLPIFSMLPPGPRSVDLDQSTKKKPGFYIDVPTRSPVSRVQLGYTPANSRLRGFGSSTTHNSGTNLFASTNTLTVSRSQTPKDNLFGSGAPSPSLGSGQRKSVKKLILDKKVEPTELFTKSGSGSPLRGAKITFSPALSIAAREKEATEAATLVASSAPSQPAKSPTPTPRPQRTPNRFTAENGAEGEESLQEGDYWSKPSVDVLKTMGFDQLSSFEGLVVGRVGYGEIHFLEPVDLTGVPRLTALLGEVIKFDDKECAVYPESEDDKPPPGSGLNVRARISLRRCWATDKAHREPIKDEKNPLAIRHVKRLKGMKDTHFESFDISDGTWTFTVDHF